MAQFELSFNMDNAAFEEFPDEEVTRILRDVADKVEEGHASAVVRDVNGNRVGAWKMDHS